MRFWKYWTTVLLATLALAAMSFRPSEESTQPAGAIQARYMQDYEVLLEQARRLKAQLASFSHPQDVVDFRDHFLALRRQFKHMEALFAYFNAELNDKVINPAPLPKQDPQAADRMVVIEPQGIQTLDEMLFMPDEEAYEEKARLHELAEKLHYDLQRIYRMHQNDHPFTDRQVIEACREELVRILALGLSGYDTPGSVNALADAQASFAAVADLVDPYLNLLEDRKLARQIRRHFTQGKYLLGQESDFESFDRLTLLREVLDPLYGLLLDLHQSLDIETYYETTSFPRSVNYYSRHIFSDEFFDPVYYTNPQAQKPEVQQLGKLLFFDPILSSNLQRSCASCHDPNQAFTDGRAKSLAIDMEGNVGRNSPTLINALYADRFFHDLSTESLQKQVQHVVVNQQEFKITYREMIERLSASPEYVERFEKAYGPSGINAHSINHALGGYVGSLHSFDSPFDRYVRGESKKIDPAVERGFNLFMGKGVCGTCHFAPTFNGTVPPRFLESESEVLGVPATPDTPRAEIDPDLGRVANGNVKEAAPFYLYSFKTPTVRNAALTAPYMHNGVYQTLEEVMHFYNIGGGKGLGIHLDHQTLPFDHLGLTQEEISDVIAFMEALTDTTGLTSVPDRLPDYPEGSPYQRRIVGGTY